jgi:hypothetical protein
MLRKMQARWIDDRLNNSVHRQVFIDLRSPLGRPPTGS